jgi:diacylglycerol kinase
MKLLRSLIYACNGIKICFTSETNFKIHVGCTVIVAIMGAICNVTTIQWSILFFCIALVIAMEMINTALEKLCDVVQPDFHPVIKKVKDIAAGAVLLSAVCSAIIGLIIFLPYILKLVKNL